VEKKSIKHRERKKAGRDGGKRGVARQIEGREEGEKERGS